MAETKPAQTINPVLEDEPVFDPKYWRPYNEEQVRHHEALNPFFHDNDLGTWILAAHEPREVKLLALKLAKTQTRTRRHTYTDNSLAKVLRLIADACSVLQLDRTTCRMAAENAHKLADKSIKGRHPAKAFTALLAAMVTSCYPQDKIAEAAKLLLGEYSSELYRTYSRYAKHLGLTIRCGNPRILASRILSDIASRLDYPRDVIEKARLLAERIAMLYFKPNIVRGLSAASMYVALKLLDEHVTQKIVASAAGISDASLRNAIAKMGLTIQYYYCTDQPRGNCILMLEWKPKKDTLGVRSPAEFAIHLGIRRYVYDYELGKPIKLWLAPTGAEKL